MNRNVSIQYNRVADFCRANGIVRLAIFGSALREDFSPESDIDILVEFEPGRTPGFGFVSRVVESPRVIAHPRPSPDPDKEISTIRLLR